MKKKKKIKENQSRYFLNNEYFECMCLCMYVYVCVFMSVREREREWVREKQMLLRIKHSPLTADISTCDFSLFFELEDMEELKRNIKANFCTVKIRLDMLRPKDNFSFFFFFLFICKYKLDL